MEDEYIRVLRNRIRRNMKEQIKTTSSMQDIDQKISSLLQQDSNLKHQYQELERTIAAEFNEYACKTHEALAKRVLTTLPRELRDMIYTYLNPPICDITITRAEARAKQRTSKSRNGPPICPLGHHDYNTQISNRAHITSNIDTTSGTHTPTHNPHPFSLALATEATISYFHLATYVIQDIDDLLPALSIPPFNNSVPASSCVRRVQIDIRTHHHHTKNYLLSKLNPRSESPSSPKESEIPKNKVCKPGPKSRTSDAPSLSPVYASITNSLTTLLNLAFSHPQPHIHIRLRTSGSGVYRSGVRTMHVIRPLVLRMKERGFVVSVEHVPVGESEWEREDLTGEFDVGEGEWEGMQRLRFGSVRG
ncbi:hypothetical protein CC78DRAFT_573063 [Lojkania enalia]|uniref:Uncharacterized protein n=1 Tax=Lojkania enalia TaxID=147567 RepID=A0A9P4N3Y2_9PLEO|nr:hypothetical protein CC78DRAFT_573063 [Didymosphaeria enalia]